MFSFFFFQNKTLNKFNLIFQKFNKFVCSALNECSDLPTCLLTELCKVALVRPNAKVGDRQLHQRRPAQRRGADGERDNRRMRRAVAPKVGPAAPHLAKVGKRRFVRVGTAEEKSAHHQLVRLAALWRFWRHFRAH